MTPIALKIFIANNDNSLSNTWCVLRRVSVRFINALQVSRIRFDDIFWSSQIYYNFWLETISILHKYTVTYIHNWSLQDFSHNYGPSFSHKYTVSHC